MRETVLTFGVPVLFLGFALAFALMSRAGRVFRWWSAAFVAAAGAYGLSAIPTPEESWAKPLLEDALFLLSLIVANVGFARRAGRPARGPLLASIALASLGTASVALVGFDSVNNEIVAMLTGCALVMFLSAFEMRHERAHAMEPALFWLCLAVAASLLIQNLAFLGSSAEPLRVSTWRETDWGFVFQVSSAATGIAVAFAILLTSGLDIIARLREAAQLDELTQVLNRRGLAQHADWLRARAAPGTDVAVVLADLDHFKGINDRFGHAAGDLVLQRFAALLREAAERGDGVARMGGEEFALILSRRGPDAAAALVETLRAALADLRWPEELADLRVTSSFGIAAWGAEETLEAVLGRADAALYAAKQGGRDRFVEAAPAWAPAAGTRHSLPPTLLEPC